jgi:nitrogen regulatory protein P-II 1
MKRIEAVIEPPSLNVFRQAAPELGIAEFDVVEVYRSGCEIIERHVPGYQSDEFAADFQPRLRLEFVLADNDVQTTLHKVLDLIKPETLAVFRLDQTIWPAFAHEAIAASSLLPAG